MSEFPWAAYDRWLTTTPEDQGHDGYCNCGSCHAGHKESGGWEVWQNSHSADFDCCKNQIESWIEEKKVCQKHPWYHLENGSCDECEIEKEKK